MRKLVLVGVGACLLAGCQSAISPRYQMTGAGQVAWRLDTKTGEMRLYSPNGYVVVESELKRRTTTLETPGDAAERLIEEQERQSR
jgi:hypothetical protein